MIDIFVKISNESDAEEFCNKVTKHDFDVDLECGKYVIDAKSILGILSLRLGSVLTLHINVDSKDECSDLLLDIDKYIIE